MNWSEATATLRSELFATAYDLALAEIETERKGKKTTETQRSLARNRAQGAVLQAVAKLPEYNGVRNPLHDDPEWGPKAKPASPKTDPKLGELVKWLEGQTWSDFATSLAAQYNERGSLSPKQVASATKMKATMDAKKAQTASKPAPKVKPTGLDLSEIPSGYYAVPGGETRLKVRVAHGKPETKWDGWTFVSDGAEYGQRKNYGRQAPSGLYQGGIVEELKAVLAAPEAAQRAYGQLTGTCGRCGRLLEDENSIAKGIGPVCENLW